MCQGGDPTGTGKGGESIYGCVVQLNYPLICLRGKFEDEITRALKHTGAG